ncbi:hypothetical protein DJICPGNB_29600 [Klebsiella pneumoniae]|nr:hypothetical protein DJICPGNB_29600 [Klebsiella pneumoniae]SVJ77567.1 Uncharacterised protein [Klebsiella pneumoniae]VEC05049.1 Uncharacterised protein [Klebsiella pneumoniae]
MVSWIISVTGIFMPDSDGTVQGATGKKDVQSRFHS